MIFAAVAAISIQGGPLDEVLKKLLDPLLEDGFRTVLWTADVDGYYSPGIVCSGDCSIERMFDAVLTGTPFLWSRKREPNEAGPGALFICRRDDVWCKGEPGSLRRVTETDGETVSP